MRIRRLQGITRNVIVLGWVSLLTDLASEMLYPVIPLFVTGILGASPAVLGLIEGVAEGGSTVLRWVTGALSDRFRRRKPFVVGGYALSAVSKPVMGLAAYALGWPLLLAGRIADRLGKSVRTSARDALIADSTDPAHRGVAFGLHRAMDTTGAVLGPLLALAAVMLWRSLPLQYLFFLALVPGLLSAALALAAIRDIPHEPQPGGGKSPSLWQHFPGAFWRLILAAGVFSLGNSSDSFLILRSKELGLSLRQVVLAFALYNATYVVGATPFGRLSDRIGRKPLIVAGWAVYAVVYAGFGVARSHLAPWFLLATYGVYQALSEGVTKALVSDVVPAHQRAGAIGLFYTVAGLGQLLASLLAGRLWSVRLAGGRILAPFAIGAACAAAGAVLIALARVPPRGRRGSNAGA